MDDSGSSAIEGQEASDEVDELLVKKRPAQALTLRAAVKACDPTAVQCALLKLGDNVAAALDASDGNGRTLLHLCAATALRPGSSEVLRLLVEHSGRLDVQDASGQTPLAIATAVALAVKDAPSEAEAAAFAVRFLQAADASATSGGLLKDTDASATSGGRHVGAPDSEDALAALLEAVDCHDVCAVRFAVGSLREEEEGATMIKAILAAFDVDGNTLLHRCAIGPLVVKPAAQTTADLSGCGSPAQLDGGEAIAALLIACQADVNDQNLLGETPLLAAARRAQAAPLGVVRALLDGRADPGRADAFAGETALMEAACSRDATLCRLLIEGRAEVAQRNSHGRTAMDLVDQTNYSRTSLQVRAVLSPLSPQQEEPSRDIPAAAQSSLEERCEQEGLDLANLGQLGAKAVLVACDRWRDMSVKQLRVECSGHGIPTEGCVEKGEITSRLRQLRVWQALPLQALLEECQRLRLVSDSAPRAEAEISLSRSDLEEELLAATYPHPAAANSGSGAHAWRIKEQCLARGILVERMGSLDHAEVVLRLVQRLESSSAAELRKEFQQRGLAVETGMEKQDMVARLRNALVWEEMPLQGLQQTCQDKGYPRHWLGGPHQATKEELLKRLISGSGMALAPETRFKNFFSYGNQPSQQKQEPPPPGSQQRTEFDKAFRSGARPPEEEFDDGWHSKAEENRRAFASGKRNHSGMPGGQRGRNGPSPPNNYKVGSEEQNWWRQQQRQGQQSRQPQPPTIDKHFKVLGLPKTATHDEVRKAYRKLALQHHPDKNPGSKQATAERMFREVVEAYDRVCEYLGSSAS